MRMFVEFDIDADIIDVPQSVIENKEILRFEFLKWLYDRKNKHKYWRILGDTMGVMYRSDAFVEWLNMTVLNDTQEKATVIQQNISFHNTDDLPSVFF